MTSKLQNRILYVAYPLLPASEESCGGAEQVLVTLEREMHARGNETAIAACDGSRAAGEMLSTGPCAPGTDAFEQRNAQHTEAVRRYAESRRFSLLHDHSGHFWPHAAGLQTPVLATLHLPRSFYREEMFGSIPSNVFFNCVSRTQLQSFSDIPRVVGVVSNGISVERFQVMRRKDNYLLWLGRICPEKAPHLAIEAARSARMKLILAGQVYPFSYHQQYFEKEVKPHLNSSDVQFVEVPSFQEKMELLRCAKAVIITSLAQETSSLVALEAQACGTPVVAFRHGALPEVIWHGHTGFVVRTLEQMIAAIHDVEHIWPEECRHWVETHFSASTMADGYDALYSDVIGEQSDTMLMAA